MRMIPPALAKPRQGCTFRTDLLLGGPGVAMDATHNRSPPESQQPMGSTLGPCLPVIAAFRRAGLVSIGLYREMPDAGSRRGKQSCRLSANRVDSAHHANRGRGKREAMEAEDRRRAGGGRLPPLSDCPVPAPRPPRVRRRPRFAVVPVPGPMPTHSTAPAGSSNDHVFDLDGISGRYQGSAVPSITLDSQSLHPGATLLHTSLLNHHQSTGIHGARQGHSC